MQVSAIEIVCLFDGAVKASHESILLEVGLFSLGRLSLCGFGYKPHCCNQDGEGERPLGRNMRLKS